MDLEVKAVSDPSMDLNGLFMDLKVAAKAVSDPFMDLNAPSMDLKVDVEIKMTSRRVNALIGRPSITSPRRWMSSRARSSSG